MKAYKIEILIVDLDEVGEEDIVSIIENANYPNDCINPQVMQIQEAEIGEWDDDHPLNMRATREEEYKRLFGGGE